MGSLGAVSRPALATDLSALRWASLWMLARSSSLPGVRCEVYVDSLWALALHGPSNPMFFEAFTCWLPCAFGLQWPMVARTRGVRWNEVPDILSGRARGRSDMTPGRGSGIQRWIAGSTAGILNLCLLHMEGRVRKSYPPRAASLNSMRLSPVGPPLLLPSAAILFACVVCFGMTSL